MIFDTLNRLAQYKGICAGLDKLIDFTLSHELNALPAGRNEIDGDLAWMNVNVAPLVPEIYNTTAMVKELAADLLFVSAAMMPVNAFTNSCYFTLRSGGKTIITFIFDSAFVWVICVPVAFLLSRYTSLAILPMYIAVQALDLIKCVIGFYLVKKRKWVNNLVAA